MKIRLAILTGGSSTEREISYKSCQNLLCFLNYDKYKVRVIDVSNNTKDLKWIEELTLFSPDIVLSTLHGGQGENGDFQGFLNTLNIKYIGSKVLTSSICINKHITKTIMKANFIPVVEEVFLTQGSNILDYSEEIKALGFPLIVKPNKGGASIGISIAEDFEQLLKIVENTKNFKDDILIERFIKGDEVTCGVIQKEDGLEVLPVLNIDIAEKSQFFDYNLKYLNDKDIVFSNLPTFLKTMIQEISKKVFLTLNCTGYANIDFIIKEEQIYFLEVNTLPGFTKSSLFPRAIKEKSQDLSEFLDELIEFELNRED